MKIPARPPSLASLLAAERSHGVPAVEPVLDRIMKLLQTEHGKDRGKEYLHWERLKHQPLPDGLESHEDWWALTKMRRTSLYRDLPLTAKDGQPFRYWLPDPLQQRLSQIDKQAAGQIESAEPVINPNSRNRYLVNSLTEEAIASSRLEGASTTRKIAKAMLREKREPRDDSERMIFNNYRAMEFARNEAQSPLTLQLIFELHGIVTEGTLQSPNDEGRLRQSDDVAVYDRRDNTLLHSPPSAEQLQARLTALCEFANADPEGEFLHPVVHAIILHFMIGYDHPFVDGNGRTARALFYWAMARHGYWLMEYVSISTLVAKAPAQYERAYLFSETDDNDLTYFIDYKLRVILQAIGQLRKHLAVKAEEAQRLESVLGSHLFAKSLNHRQAALVSHALRNPGGIYTIEGHRNSHQITYPTARSDLLRLADLGLLEKTKISRAFVFRAVADVEQRLAELRDGG